MVSIRSELGSLVCLRPITVAIGGLSDDPDQLLQIVVGGRERFAYNGYNALCGS